MNSPELQYFNNNILNKQTNRSQNQGSVKNGVPNPRQHWVTATLSVEESQGEHKETQAHESQDNDPGDQCTCD